MTLNDLVTKYKSDAEARFDVNIIRDDNIEDVVVFMNSEVRAIKESIVGAEVSRYRVTAVNNGVPTIAVLVREADESEEPPADNTPEEVGGD